MSESIKNIEDEIVSEFELFGDDWEGKYEHLIELGKSIPLIHPELKNEKHLISGCQSQVWLHHEMKDGKLFFYGDSDAAIPKGIIALMIRVLSGHTPSEIVDANLDFINQIGLKDHLSPTRANGLLSMIKQMKLIAVLNKKT
jgi:cysteine desulfuration protein SufE